MMEYGLTTERRCPSLSTPPPSTCPTRGPSPSSRFLLATRSRYSPGPWRSTTPGSATPSCRTAPSTHTPSVSALPRDGARSTAGRVLTAVPAGWKCYSGLQRDEKSTQPSYAPHRLISFRTFLLETELLAFTVCNRCFDATLLDTAGCHHYTMRGVLEIIFLYEDEPSKLTTRT